LAEKPYGFKGNSELRTQRSARWRIGNRMSHEGDAKPVGAWADQFSKPVSGRAREGVDQNREFRKTRLKIKIKNEINWIILWHRDCIVFFEVPGLLGAAARTAGTVIK
jgi:hypothetical protein